ncbi:MAG: acyl-CoA dehydrogenase family protein [Ignavibacteria bacterium]|nr:acyl-CoA dehydrogenase family protein [Ignavibacteria bacterium]
MKNFFLDHSDRLFYFDILALDHVIELKENDFNDIHDYPDAPKDLNDAKGLYKQVLEIAGDITANEIEMLADKNDKEGVHFKDGQVEYPDGIKKSLDILKKTGMNGVCLPRKYNGLNLPYFIGILISEMISQADSSLLTIYSLQEIASTINKFGNEEQKKAYLPLFAEGELSARYGIDRASKPGATSRMLILKLFLTPWREYGS